MSTQDNIKTLLQVLLQPTQAKIKRGNQIPVIRCMDGFTFSMQASAHHLCAPRNNEGPWTSVEIYFGWSSSLRPKKGWGRTPRSGVESYVPLDRVAALVAAHGGLDMK